MIEKVALLPCPFCGNKNVKYDCGSVDCDQCDTTGPYSSSGLDEATAAWNTRAAIEAMPLNASLRQIKRALLRARVAPDDARVALIDEALDEVTEALRAAR